MEIRFTKTALDDLAYWKKNGNKQIQLKIEALLADIAEHPFTGIGKPEPLRFELAITGQDVLIQNIVLSIV